MNLLWGKWGMIWGPSNGTQQGSFGRQSVLNYYVLNILPLSIKLKYPNRCAFLIFFILYKECGLSLKVPFCVICWNAVSITQPHYNLKQTNLCRSQCVICTVMKSNRQCGTMLGICIAVEVGVAVARMLYKGRWMQHDSDAWAGFSPPKWQKHLFKSRRKKIHVSSLQCLLNSLALCILLSSSFVIQEHVLLPIWYQ